MKWRKLTLAVLLSFGILARPVHGETAQTPFQFTKVDLNLLNISNQLDDYFQQQGLVFDDDATTKYIDSVGRSVLPPGPPPEHVVWKFHVLRDPEPNAFALPNGSIYIQTGLLSLMQNEAQLAAILGHEETHVLARHPYLEYRDIRKTNVALNVLGVAGDAYGVGVAGAVAAAVSTVAGLALVESVYGYSRELEQQADMRGLQAMEAAGYDPTQMAEVFRLLEKSEGPDSSHSLYRDHPRLEARIKYLTEELKEHPPAASAHILNAATYSESTEAVSQHDVGLEIAGLRARQGLAVALHLSESYPTSGNYVLLGDAYRAMGGRLPNPSDQQLEEERKQDRRMLRRKTPQEYEAFLLSTPDGEASWKENRKKAEAAYEKAIEFDASNAEAHRGLALVFDDAGNTSGAISEYQEYLELAPKAWDHAEIQKRLAALEAPPSSTQPSGPAPIQAPGGKS
jgi:beta-barrel assembly-enhancing protease